MNRADISPNLIHFTSGDDYVDAFRRLRKIIEDRKLIAGTRFIKGKYPCVCFSEAPLSSLSDGLVNEDSYSRYSPFGIMVSKKWLFAQGGRPVIYETDREYRHLPESLRWRHVAYDIRDGFENIDFTWEREWRIPCHHLSFGEASAVIVVLDKTWAKRLISEHQNEEDWKVMQYSLIMDEDIAQQYAKSFRWRVAKLR